MPKNEKTRGVRPWTSLLAVVAFVMLFPGGPVQADIVPGTSSTDPFDSSQGTTILASDAGVVDPINAFRTSGGFEDGHALMPSAPLGGAPVAGWIEFETPSPRTIEGLRLFGQSDANGERRIEWLKLFADVDLDGSYETLLVTQSIAQPYSQVAGNVYHGVNNGYLDIAISLGAPVTAAHWRLEIKSHASAGARLVELDAVTNQGRLDVKPNSCPNPLLVNANGVVPVAIVGTEAFDATDVDPASVRLEGVAPKPNSARVEDVIRPYEGGFSDPLAENECIGDLEEPADGIDDLTLKFPMSDVQAALCPGVAHGDVVLLTIEGTLLSGGAFEGQDVVRIQGLCPP